MIRLPILQGFPRVAVYAVLAALVTTALFTAEAAYRWSVESTTKAVTAPPVEKRAAKAPDPAPVAGTSGVGTPASPAPAASPQTPAQNPDSVLQPVLTATVPVRTATVPVEPAPVPSFSPALPAQTHAATPETTRIEPRPDTRGGTLADERSAARPAIAPRQKPQKAVQQRTRTEARRATAKPPVQAHGTAQKRTLAVKPNVYYERDSQLGFAPQLRKRICNPATGQMPMQCYYPREGRERFPARSGSQ